MKKVKGLGGKVTNAGVHVYPALLHPLPSFSTINMKQISSYEETCFIIIEFKHLIGGLTIEYVDILTLSLR